MLDLLIGEWMATQSVVDVVKSAQASRICLTPVHTMAQLEADEHFRERSFFAMTPAGVRIPGPCFRSDQGWWSIRSDAPTLGQHTGEGWNPRPSPAAAMRTTAEDPTRPLDGVRVCDFSWIWAGPYCTQILAHLGADVIKLESPEHVCLFRRLPYAPLGMPLTPDTGGVFQLYNTDKRSVGIDLAMAEARAVIERLVASSDVVVVNFGVGTMARLGYGPDDLRRINPNVVVVSLTGYGQSGPAATNMAYGPAGGAMAGLYAATGYEGGTAAETGIAIGDPGTGIAGAWAIVVALVAQRAHGEVASIDVAMVEAVAATVGEPWMAYQQTGQVPGPAGNRDLAIAPHGCFAAAGEDRWVTIACPTDASWRALCSAVDPALLDDSRFLSMADRKRNEPDLDVIIEAWTKVRDRWEITRTLQSVGVAAFPSMSPLELWSGDPQLHALGMLERPVHRAVGVRHAARDRLRSAAEGARVRHGHGGEGLPRVGHLRRRVVCLSWAEGRDAVRSPQGAGRELLQVLRAEPAGLRGGLLQARYEGGGPHGAAVQRGDREGGRRCVYG